MTTVQGFSDDLIIITHNGKEIEFTPIFPHIKNYIGFSDGSLIAIVCDHNDVWEIIPYIRGHIEAELYRCSAYGTSDVYKTMADPDRIEYQSMHGTSILRLDKEV